ncbi:MAG: alpha/beta fold hydrolase [Leptolyngbya sp. IPPAS B-1204]|nr:MAG: alpha/beta hydrolase [Leptolyngbya sp. IPPAS B-1204]
MSNFPQVLWLNVSPSLQRFHQPLLRHLSSQFTVACWDYCQTPDEACSLETAITLLHDYLKICDQPLHLIGHGTGGLLALLYSRRYPDYVKTLSLLSVGVHPAVDWQAHYYVHRQLLSCKQEAILAQMTPYLFGEQTQLSTRRLVRVLKRDLENSLSPHSLFRRVSIAAGNVAVPLMVCGGEVDIVVDPNQLYGWQDYLKTEDRLWICPDGCHFFDFSYPELVATKLIEFWTSVLSNHFSLINF